MDICIVTTANSMRSTSVSIASQTCSSAVPRFRRGTSSSWVEQRQAALTLPKQLLISCKLENLMPHHVTLVPGDTTGGEDFRVLEATQKAAGCRHRMG